LERLANMQELVNGLFGDAVVAVDWVLVAAEDAGVDATLDRVDGEAESLGSFGHWNEAKLARVSPCHADTLPRACQLVNPVQPIQVIKPVTAPAKVERPLGFAEDLENRQRPARPSWRVRLTPD
jgi:hypothetical protein